MKTTKMETTTGFQKGKVFSLFGKGGKTMVEIVPKTESPLLSRVYDHDGSQFAVISLNDENGVQKIVAISESNPRILTIDEYSRPWSEKFGIGHYYDDVEPDFRFIEFDVLIYVEWAKNAEVKRLQQEQEACNESNLLTERLKSEYSFMKLNPTTYHEERNNMIAYLEHCFAGTKFSVKKNHFDSITIKWKDGATEKEVEAEADRFSPYAFDQSGDFYDRQPSEFASLFGSFKFLHYDRTSTVEEVATSAGFVDVDDFEANVPVEAIAPADEVTEAVDEVYIIELPTAETVKKPTSTDNIKVWTDWLAIADRKTVTPDDFRRSIDYYYSDKKHTCIIYTYNGFTIGKFDMENDPAGIKNWFAAWVDGKVELPIEEPNSMDIALASAKPIVEKIVKEKKPTKEKVEATAKVDSNEPTENPALIKAFRECKNLLKKCEAVSMFGGSFDALNAAMVNPDVKHTELNKLSKALYADYKLLTNPVV